MTTVTSYDHRTFALEVTTTAHGRTVRASVRVLVGAGADHPVWAGVAGDALEHVTLDLCAVTAIDAGGLGRLLRVRQRLGARGARLTISAAAPRVGRMLHMTGSIPGHVDRRAALPPAVPDADGVDPEYRRTRRTCSTSRTLQEWDFVSETAALTRYKGYRFPPEIISCCVWLYYRFGVSLRDVSELMLARGIEVSHEAIAHFPRDYLPWKPLEPDPRNTRNGYSTSDADEQAGSRTLAPNDAQMESGS